MAGAALAAGKGIKHKGVDDSIDIVRVAQSSNQSLAGGQIGSAYVIAHGEQTVKLVLGVCKTVLIQELIDGPLKGHCHLADLLLCLFLGHGVLHIIIHLVLGAFRSVADRISAIGFNIGLSAEAFIVFDKGNSCVTDLHI